PSFSGRVLGGRILWHHFSAVGPSSKETGPSVVCRRSSPSTAFADLIVENGILMRGLPSAGRKYNSDVSRSTLPVDFRLPKCAVQLGSLPIPLHFCKC